MQNKKIKIKDPEGRKAEPLSWAVGLSITKLKRPGTTFPFVSKLPPKGQTRSLRSPVAGDSWLFMNEGLLLSLNHSTRQSCQQDPRQLRSHGRLQESREVAWPPAALSSTPTDRGQGTAPACSASEEHELRHSDSKLQAPCSHLSDLLQANNPPLVCGMNLPCLAPSSLPLGGSVATGAPVDSSVV